MSFSMAQAQAYDSSPPWAAPGDWPCPNASCKNARSYVFAKHDNCPACGAPKEQQPDKPWSRPGDWACPNSECKNAITMVFASKAKCPSCGADRPAGKSSPY